MLIGQCGLSWNAPLKREKERLRKNWKEKEREGGLERTGEFVRERERERTKRSDLEEKREVWQRGGERGTHGESVRRRIAEDR